MEARKDKEMQTDMLSDGAQSPHESGSARVPRALFLTTIPLTITSFLMPLATRLIERGWHVDCGAANASHWPGLTPFGHVYDLGWSRSPRCYLHYPAIARQLQEIVRSGHYDIVHVHTPIAAQITRQALSVFDRSQRPTIIYTAHGLHFYEGNRSAIRQQLYQAMEKRAFPHTDVVITMNDEDTAVMQRWASEYPHIHTERIDGMGLDFASYEDLRALKSEQGDCAPSDGAAHNKPCHLLMIAEMNENKRHALLLDALSLVEERESGSFTLTLAGDGRLRPQLEARVAQCALGARTTFTGQVSPEEIHKLLAQADLGVLVSEREGLPRGLMETCAAGVCIAGTDTRGIRDEVIDRRALADDTPASLAITLEALIQDAALRASIAQMQYEHARVRYDSGVILAAYEDLYNSVIRERRAH